MEYLAIILILGLLIFAHELGHFICAKLMNINIAVFSIGFGPKIWKYHIKETEYRVSIIPLGGYVFPAIENEEEFYRIPVYKRIIFSLGGPLANIFLPVIILMILYIVNFGFSPELFTRPFIQVYGYMHAIINSLPRIFDNPEQLSGIVGIVQGGAHIIGSGSGSAVSLLILLSLNLAVFNMLPIPALDGGKIMMYILEKIHPKLLKIQMPATIAGWLLILGLMLYATINDVSRLFA